MRSVWPNETSPASKSALEVMLIALYDVGVHGGHLAHGALPALLAVADAVTVVQLKKIKILKPPERGDTAIGIPTV